MIRDGKVAGPTKVNVINLALLDDPYWIGRTRPAGTTYCSSNRSSVSEFS